MRLGYYSSGTLRKKMSGGGMKDSALSLPDQRNYEYSLGLSYDIAREQLVKIADIERQCQKCGADYQRQDSSEIITLSYLNRPCQITLPTVLAIFSDTGDEIPLREKLLILHYFINAKGIPLSHKVISFKELAGVKNYFRTFHKRAIQPLLNAFGTEPQKLVEAGKLFGGQKADYGDAAVTIDAFDRVPITYVLWQSDEEFPPEGNVMYDSTVTDYLPNEDIIVLSEILAWKLVKSAKG
jgi:hypothetical protein